MLGATWANTTIIRSNFANEVAKLKSGAGKDIVAFGGAGLVASLLQADLVDEYRIMVTPMLLGGGKPLFPADFKRTALKLVDSKIMDTGAVVSHYARA
jgi:dihydrofolate reductase